MSMWYLHTVTCGRR